jgi:hypothetical protein
MSAPARQLLTTLSTLTHAPYGRQCPTEMVTRLERNRCESGRAAALRGGERGAVLPSGYAAP